MIVVIAILATISLVAYNGIQNRAKSSSGQSLVNFAKRRRRPIIQLIMSTRLTVNLSQIAYRLQEQALGLA
ncbi:hypothetical protein IPF89_03265 [Candidatus Saccharibacteria bacterium]|nr:MAG: hypothetical protein IPF89_03265 [Candidatus Saccharibacteria bacterium]